MSPVLARTAAAPISWGICEVPGWGVQLPVDRVLPEMGELGFTATELGSVGYLPTEPGELRELLGRHHLELAGGFNALALADPSVADAALAQAEASAALLAAAGAHTFVTCVVSDPDDWRRPELSESQWAHMMHMLGEVDALCADNGLVQAFHPHVDSLVETLDEILRVLHASEVQWVLETGHMFIGGLDPVGFAREHAERVQLVHLKDLRADLATRLNANELTLMEAVQEGLFVPLGTGDAKIAEVITALEAQGYDGWYVIEQDAAITGSLPEPGDGPIRDVEDSVAFLRHLDTQLAAS